MVAHRQEFRVSSDTMTIPITLWSPDGDFNSARPLLVAHDRTEYGRDAKLIDKMAWWISEHTLEPHNVALLSPDDMNNNYRLAHYAASEEYHRVLTGLILPELKQRASTNAVIGMGASMGALAMLHSADAFDGLFLQSASIHHSDYGNEQNYMDMYAEHGQPELYDPVKQFVEKARVNLTDGKKLTISMTCGDESNYAGNKDIFYALRNQGHEVIGGHVPNGGHNFESWGTNLDPHLRDLLRVVGSMHR